MKICYKRNLNLCLVALGVLVSFLLSGCGGSSSIGNAGFSENIFGYELEYNGKINLERVGLKSDDLDEIVDLFQEVGDNVWYRDSLLIAEKYAQGLGANAFAQDNIETLQNQGLMLSNIQKTQIGLVEGGKKITGVLVEYEITEGLMSDFPLLYVSQLFIPRKDKMIFMSFITEDKTSHLNALNMFKNIK